MEKNNLISRSELAERWAVTSKTIDRLRKRGDLPWIDVTSGKGKKPLVRFMIIDVEAYETRNRKAPFEGKEARHDKR
jgi:hypothetical protein